MKTLLELVKSIDRENDEDTIYAKKPWTAESPVLVARDPSSGGTPARARSLQCEYFLEVFIAREFLEDLRNASDDPIAVEALCDRLIYYAMYDA